jgi:ribosome recycling factor
MSDWSAKMHKTVRHLADQLSGMRPGALSVGFVETFRVALHGSPMPLRHVASVAREADRIIVRPFDAAHVPSIVKSLTESKLNAYAQDPTTVCVTIPPMSGEQRADMARHVKKLGEEAKIAIRAIRQDARKAIAARGRGSQRAVQEATDAAVAEIDRLVKIKVDDLARSSG